MTTTHIMSDETGQLILAQLQAISQALDDGALSNSQIDTVLADQSPTGAGFLDGGGLKRFFDGLQAQFADISHNHSGDALTPASVAATGAVSGSSISDGTGTLAQLRESVSKSELYSKMVKCRNGSCTITRYGKYSPLLIFGDQSFLGITYGDGAHIIYDGSNGVTMSVSGNNLIITSSTDLDFMVMSYREFGTN